MRSSAAGAPSAKETTVVPTGTQPGPGSKSLGGIEPRGDAGQGLVLPEESGLPVGGAVGTAHLHRRHLVFRAVRRPVRVVRGDDVGAGLGVVKGGVDDP